MAVLEKRLFLGNLPSKVTQSDVTKKLSRFGNVHSVEMKQRTDSQGDVLSSFAFVDIAANASDLENCFKYFENEQWHRHKIKVQLAKESFLDRLKRERKSVANSNESSTPEDVNMSVGEVSQEKISKLQSKFVKNHLDQGSWGSNDETPEKKRSRVSHDVVKLSTKKLSSERNICSPDLNQPSIKNRTAEYSAESSNGLPKFCGTKFITGEVYSEAKDDDCDLKSQRHKNTDFKNDKVSSPPSVSHLKKPKVGEIFNSSEVEDICEDAPRRNKNLPMFCGTSALIGQKNSVKIVDLQHSPSEDVVDKGDVQGCITTSRSKRKSVRQGSDALGEEYNIHNCSINEDPHVKLKSEVKSKISRKSVSPSPKIREPTSCHQERNIAKPKSDFISERKRLNALEERKKAFDLQKEAVKQALSSVDFRNRSNKKIIFDDDDDIVPESSGKEKIPSIQSENSKPKLFQDESDEEDVKDLEPTEFKIKPQFEGRQGQKLLEIQSRYGHDSRFNLDERFLESDEEGGTKDDPPGEEDLSEEKDHQLNILREMLGVDVTSTKPKRVDKSRDSFQMVRFDPTDPKHSKYLVKEEDLKKRGEEEGGDKKGSKAEADSGKVLPKKAKKEVEVEDEPVPVVMDRFYKVSDKLKESLRKRVGITGQGDEGAKQQSNSGGFSLLQKFGSPWADNEQEEAEYSTKAISRKRNEWEKNPFRYDSSEEDDDEDVKSGRPSETKDEKSVKVKTEEPSGVTSVTETFYFLENDPRLQEGLNFFGVEKTFAEMQEGFNEKRTDLKMIIKAKVRNNKRRNRPLKKKLGGARRHKKKMAAFGVKR
ncbi:nucleolar protein 8 [Ischnura elegans]|uniref:nucleolar protein 8 n=1 Tax=Ischnura elegans TaxID=197161 RepID=UPI001ED89F94|nr:nucleolar protein 8 [Ischnura elegans]